MNKRILLIGFIVCLCGGILLLLTQKQKDEKKEEGIGDIAVFHSQPKSELDKLLDNNFPIKADISSRIPQVNSADAQRVREALFDTVYTEHRRNEMIDLLRRSGDPELNDALRGILHDENQSDLMRTFAVQHLFISADKSEPFTREKLTIEIAKAFDLKIEMVQREAFLALVRLKHELPMRIIMEGGLEKPEYEYLRDQIIRATLEYKLVEKRPKVRSFLTSNNPKIQVAAINTLGNWNDKESIDALNQLKDNGSTKRVKKAAVKALQKLHKI